MKKTLFLALSTMAMVAITGIGTVHAANTSSLMTILSCHFEKEGQKGQEDKECKATFAVLPAPTDANDRPTTPGNQFIVKCDDDTIYDGGAFFQSVELAPGIGASVVAGNTGIVAGYPVVNVDGAIGSPASFDDADARLYFSADRFIRGKCDHHVSVR